MFRKPSIADIYVQQLRDAADRSYIPLYPPDAVDVRVGTIGRFVDGAFERRGHLAEILGGEAAFSAAVPCTPASDPSRFAFHSADKVRLGPSATVSLGGRELLEAKLSFTGDRAVVATFTGVRERAVASPRDFDDLLWRLYVEGDLHRDEVVVGTHRGAAAGTVLVNRKGGVDVDLHGDPALIGAISLEGLGAGIQLATGSQVSAQTTGTNLCVGVKAKGLGRDDRRRIDDARGFEADAAGVLEDLQGAEVPLVAASTITAEVDFSGPEEG